MEGVIELSIEHEAKPSAIFLHKIKLHVQRLACEENSMLLHLVKITINYFAGHSRVT